MARDLRGRSMVITGASSGIGAATARACAQAGMHLVLNARRADRLDAVADDIRTSTDVDVRTCAGSVTDTDMSARLLDEASSLPGGLYAVFANAGYGMDRGVAATSMDDIRTMFDVNVFAATELCVDAAQRLAAADAPGHLLMCSSCLSRFPLPWYGVYSATKSAQSHMCGAMRAELKTRGIAVSSVHPIGTKTEFGAVARSLSGTADDGAGKATPANTPSALQQSPDRVARAVVRCLRRPRPEVWTSWPMRMLSGWFAMSPRSLALVGDRYASRHVRPAVSPTEKGGSGQTH